MFRALARRLLRRIALWAAADTDVRLGYGTDDRNDEVVVGVFEDGMGLYYQWERSPDQVRTLAWEMIRLADAVDETVRQREARELRW